jgi:hypothetical protein
MRGRGNPILLVDGGDCFFATPTIKAPSRSEELQALRNARSILYAYNYMGYQALGLGPADLQFGLEALKDLLGEARFPILCANLVHKETGKPVFQDSVVIEAGGIRFGIYGVMLSKINAAYQRRVLPEDVALLDAVETTQKLVPELRKRCDVVIALSHINEDENFRLVASTPGIDVVIDPYSKQGNQAVWINEGEYVLPRGGSAIVRIDGQGSRVGVFEMHFPAARTRFASYKGYDYPLEPQIFPHPELARGIRDLERGRTKSLKVAFDPHEVRLLEDLFLGEEACGSCHEKQHAFWEATRHRAAYESLTGAGDHLRHECIECHTVAYGVTFVEPGHAGRFQGVQCESCHGVNPSHADNPKLHKLGKVDESTCWGCHNPQILEKDFDYYDALRTAACPKMEN